ncbi:MAG: NUDIX hydrolase [Pseudomonadaceae bacterium]|nr:NUDIX hydrolase [Pseudomonadaceae bacterium]
MSADYRELVRAEIACLAPVDDLEAADIASSMRWVAEADEICRRRKPDVPNKHLVSYFLLRDGDYLLLVDHINAELWLPTGGHVEPDEHPRDAVHREALEELGLLPDYDVGAPVFLTVTQTVGKTSGHTDVSLWYVIEVSRERELTYDSSEFHSIRWFHKTCIPRDRCEPNLERVLKKFSLAA